MRQHEKSIQAWYFLETVVRQAVHTAMPSETTVLVVRQAVHTAMPSETTVLVSFCIKRIHGGW
jgi:hypothetical protein